MKNPGHAPEVLRHTAGSISLQFDTSEKRNLLMENKRLNLMEGSAATRCQLSNDTLAF